MVVSTGSGKGCWRACSEVNADKYLVNKTSEFFKSSEVYLIILCYALLFAQPISLHLQAADPLLGDMDMERTLETHGAIDVIRCLHGADGQHVVLPGHGCASQPALGDAASDSGCAR